MKFIVFYFVKNSLGDFYFDDLKYVFNDDLILE